MDEKKLTLLQERLKEAQAAQKWALKSEMAPRIHAMIDLARSEENIAIDYTAFDRDPWLLNCENGTLELRTARLREHRRADYLTKLCPTPYLPDANCDLWCDTLLKVFGGKAELANYFQRLCGYCLTGDTREVILPILWGAGSNGKSLVIEVIRDVMGPDYACAGADDLIASGDQKPHPTGLADLHGRRLVTLAETGEDGRLNEVLVKRLTGGDVIRARRMREDYWEFAPTHKIWIATNHKPAIRGGDHGVWRRLRLIPFEVTFWDADKGESGPDHLRADKSLKDRLRAEYPGILAWMVRGCMEWQTGGLREPGEVSVATDTYKNEQDVIARFLADCCEFGSAKTCKSSKLYEVYVAWHESNHERGRAISMVKFSEALMKKGFTKERSNGIWFRGITVASH